MKPYLPYNILLVLAIAAGGLVVLYNLVLRESYATVLQYSYPAIQQPAPEIPPQPVDTERIYPKDYPAPVLVEFPLDLNVATVEQLKLIPQVGDVMAQRIVQYRDVLGGYTSLEQLQEIKGVGDQTYQRLSAYLEIKTLPAAELVDESSGEDSP